MIERVVIVTVCGGKDEVEVVVIQFSKIGIHMLTNSLNELQFWSRR